jgi:hypothetical protein
MATHSTDLLSRNVPIAEAPTSRRRWLFHPIADFVCLGGGSLVVLALIGAFIPATPEMRASFAAVALFVAHAINHPRFAHSYQIFYSGYATKAFGETTPRMLRWRYIVAGIVVPVALVGFFAIAIPLGDVALLGNAANLMMLLVGWHYAKQGYGMLMVDAAFKRQRFDASERKAILLNTHIGWVVHWITVNSLLTEASFWGIPYSMLAVPQELVWLGWAVVGATTLRMAWMLVRKGRREGTLPWNGLVAYVAAIYAWLYLFKDPLFILIIPAFHSLQYLVVVWRYRLNAARDGAEAKGRADQADVRTWTKHAGFLVAGVVLGFLGFWLVPSVLATLPYDKTIFGGTLFLFVAWIFINVHHYFLDNVMWRRENPDTKKYLFG